jgi:hypothetical protein
MNVELQRDDFNCSGLYRGSVLDTNDPLKLGRIKVNVFGLFDTIAAANLPWAVPMQPVGSGAGAGYGIFSVPEVGSTVFVMFEGGDVYQPVYIGSAPDGVHGLPSEKNTNYPNRRIIKTKAGIVVYIDDTDQKIRITHPTGKYVEMNISGDVIIDAADITITGSGEINIDGVGDVNITGATVNLNP